MGAYLFWYKLDIDLPTEYVYVIATSQAQAWFYFKETGHTRYKDYGGPVGYVNKNAFIRKHEIGDVLGSNAVL